MEFFTTSAGITVHVWDTRDETDRESLPCLVLLHGYLETMYIYNELVEALKDRCRLIVLDMPGHGLTDSAPAGEDGRRVNSLAFQARTVAGVLDKCGVTRAVIAGHSMGGYVTLQFLKDFPKRAEKAILLHSNPYADSPEKSADRQREEQLILDGKLQSLAAVSIPKMYDEENLRACDEKIRETVELCETHDPEGIVAAIEGLRTRPDLQEVMKEPPVPLMLVHGDHDNFLPLEKVAAMKDAFPKVRYELIPGTGHNSFIERLETVKDILLSFTTGNC
ncbi:MAG: alpha/beta hydrolase [Bacteroidales bacterium]|nr:alpha/beta hydrolase [Bacteroidales bacterium]